MRAVVELNDRGDHVSISFVCPDFEEGTDKERKYLRALVTLIKSDSFKELTDSESVQTKKEEMATIRGGDCESPSLVFLNLADAGVLRILSLPPESILVLGSMMKARKIELPPDPGLIRAGVLTWMLLNYHHKGWRWIKEIVEGRW